MGYSKGAGGGSRQPASKIGHLDVVNSQWVRDLVQQFERAPGVANAVDSTPWRSFDPTATEPLNVVWAADGSFVPVTSQDSPPREVAFVKAALLTIDRARLGRIDPQHPHPILLQDIMRTCGVQHATAFPLRNIGTTLGSNYDAVRHIAHESILRDQHGAFHATLKWLCYREWSGHPTASPAFQCPHLTGVDGEPHDVPGLPPSVDGGGCPVCRRPVFLTDVFGLHMEMGEDQAPASIASAYMAIMEHLMILTAVRLSWQHTDPQFVTNALFIKDGPLTLRGQYSKLVDPIREFLQHAKQVGRPVHIIGQEKSGAFFDHLAAIARHAPPHAAGEQPTYHVLSHDYVRREVQRAPNLANPYGFKTNWGEKVYVKLEPSTDLVLSVPTGAYHSDASFPSAGDLIGLPRILASLPGLISRKYGGGLYPVELADGIASLSSYPSAEILRRFASGDSLDPDYENRERE
ncbi:MAG TPA: hypothetical protein VH475_20550 [Tepidisphaeraceae bacterium]